METGSPLSLGKYRRESQNTKTPASHSLSCISYHFRERLTFFCAHFYFSRKHVLRLFSRCFDDDVEARLKRKKFIMRNLLFRQKRRRVACLIHISFEMIKHLRALYVARAHTVELIHAHTRVEAQRGLNQTNCSMRWRRGEQEDDRLRTAIKKLYHLRVAM
jgi:hypothetical protein